DDVVTDQSARLGLAEAARHDLAEEESAGAAGNLETAGLTVDGGAGERVDSLVDGQVQLAVAVDVTIQLNRDQILARISAEIVAAVAVQILINLSFDCDVFVIAEVHAGDRDTALRSDIGRVRGRLRVADLLHFAD